MDFIASPKFKERVDRHARQSQSTQGRRPLEGRKGGGWETHHLAGSRVEAMVQQLWNAGRVLTAQTASCNHGQRLCFPRGAERPFRGARKRRQEGPICKSKQDVQELLKCPASPERTRRGIHFPKGWTRPLQLRFTKPREQRRQLTATIN